MARLISFPSSNDGKRTTCGDSGYGRDLLCNHNAAPITIEEAPSRVCLVQISAMTNGLKPESVGRKEHPVPIFAKEKSFLTIQELIR